MEKLGHLITNIIVKSHIDFNITSIHSKLLPFAVFEYVAIRVSNSVLKFTKRLSAEIWTPEGWSAMALKAAFMMGEG